TQDSKASAFSRLLFAMRPWYAREPSQVDGLLLATVADPIAVSRAFALQAILDAPDRSRPDPPAAPAWVQRFVPILGRFWADGLRRIHRLALNQNILDWARNDPTGLREAARYVAAHKQAGDNPGAQRLVRLVSRPQLDRLLRWRPQGLVEG